MKVLMIEIKSIKDAANKTLKSKGLWGVRHIEIVISNSHFL